MELRAASFALFVALFSCTASTPQQHDPRYRPDTDVDLPLSRVYSRQTTTPNGLPPWHEFHLPTHHPMNNNYGDTDESGDDYVLFDYDWLEPDDGTSKPLSQDETTGDFEITERAQDVGMATTDTFLVDDHQHESNRMHSSASYPAHSICTLALPFSIYISWFLKFSYY